MLFKPSQWEGLSWRLIRSLLFTLDPERGHRFVMGGLAAWSKWTHPSPLFSRQKRHLFGLDFPNPVGLAAGFDKDAEAVPALQQLGFGFLEVGTVTAKPQEGNPSPRLFRLPSDGALMNRLGFNNAGAIALAGRMERYRAHKQVVVPVGVNIGKSKVVPNSEAAGDYLESFVAVADIADYIAVNVSSPNTPHLRELQQEEALRKLLDVLAKANAQRRTPRPLTLKLSPDLDLEGAIASVEIAREHDFKAIIISNTTIMREGLRGPIPDGSGGISGKPLFQRSTELLRQLKQHFGDKICFIGVGGIMSQEDVVEKFAAGADLIQLYTSLIYNGPLFPRRLVHSLESLDIKRREC